MWFILCVIVAPILLEIRSKVIQVRDRPGPNQTRFTPKETIALSELRSYIFESPPRGLESFDIDTNTTRNWLASDPYFDNDLIVVRFLRAKNLDVKAAAQMIFRALKWRKENQMDSILNETFPDLPADQHTFEGFDNEGRPVVYLTPNSINLRKLLLAGKRDRILRRLDQVLEQGLQVLRNLTMNGHRSPNGEEITQFVLVNDGSGFNMANHMCLQCTSVLMEFGIHYENYYPDAFKYMITINSPKNAVPIMQMFTPVLSRASRTAIKIFGPDKLKWSAFLRSIIPEGQLPIRYGGKMLSRLN